MKLSSVSLQVTRRSPSQGGFVRQWALPILCLVAVAALGASVWQGSQRLETVARETARQLEAERRSAAQALEQARAAQAEMRSLRERIAVLEAGQADMRGQQNSLEALYLQLIRGQDDWVLAEVEQTLQIAAQQLALAGNRSSTIAALQFVEQRLADATRADLVALREAVRLDLDALNAARGLDLGGMILQLDQVISRIDALPLISEPSGTRSVSTAEANSFEGPIWQRLWLDLRSELRSLIDVRRVDDPRVLQLSPDQAVVLRENLKLRLLNARLALMSRQSAAWHDDLDAALQAFETYFDLADPSVRLQVSRIRALRATDLSEALPTLSSVAVARAARVRDVAAPQSSSSAADMNATGSDATGNTPLSGSANASDPSAQQVDERAEPQGPSEQVSGAGPDSSEATTPGTP